LKNIDSSAVTIITRPPEIVACLKLRLMDKNVFIIFDSHPRPSYPNGAGMIASTSIESTARRLTELLPTVDLPDGVLQWQAQLLSNCSGHVFVPHGVDVSMPTLWQAVLESSLAQLSMQTAIADLRSQNELQTNEHQRLERELKEAEARHRRQESLIQQLQSGSSRGATHNARFPTSPEYSSPTYQSSRPSSSRASTSPLNDFSPPQLFSNASTSGTNNFTSAPSSSSSRSAGLRDSPRSLPTPPLDHDDDDYPYSLQLQRDFEAYNRVATTQRPQLSWVKSSQPSLDSLSHALQLQREFDAEDRALAAQRAELSRSVQRLFECGICMEEMPEDSKACPDPCGHPFCRDCLRGHVSARLEEHRFPILCPTCTAGKGKGKGVTGGR
jgi:Ring finger domain